MSFQVGDRVLLHGKSGFLRVWQPNDHGIHIYLLEQDDGMVGMGFTKEKPVKLPPRNVVWAQVQKRLTKEEYPKRRYW